MTSLFLAGQDITAAALNSLAAAAPVVGSLQNDTTVSTVDATSTTALCSITLQPGSYTLDAVLSVVNGSAAGTEPVIYISASSTGTFTMEVVTVGQLNGGTPNIVNLGPSSTGGTESPIRAGLVAATASVPAANATMLWQCYGNVTVTSATTFTLAASRLPAAPGQGTFTAKGGAYIRAIKYA